MPTILRCGKNTEELTDVLSLRYEVMEAAGRVPSDSYRVSRKIIDPFDVYPTTSHFIGYRNGKSVGTIRALEYRNDENGLNQIFDFRESTKNLKGDCYFLDMLAVRRDLAGHSIFLRELLRMPLQNLAQRGPGHVFINVPKGLWPAAEELGCLKLRDSFYSDILGIEIQPSVFSLKDIQQGIGHDVVDQEIIRFQEVFYVAIFDPGEVLVMEGEKGTTAYLIEEGEVEVLVQQGGELVPISSIPQGRLIGEIAMVTNEPRTASLIAKRTTSCIAFDRADFMRLMLDEPHRTLDFFKIFSRRLNESNQRLAELRKGKTP